LRKPAARRSQTIQDVVHGAWGYETTGFRCVGFQMLLHGLGSLRRKARGVWNFRGPPDSAVPQAHELAEPSSGAADSVVGTAAGRKIVAAANARADVRSGRVTASRHPPKRIQRAGLVVAILEAISAGTAPGKHRQLVAASRMSLHRSVNLVSS